MAAQVVEGICAYNRALWEIYGITLMAFLSAV